MLVRGLSLLLITAIVSACEKDCRLGVSNDLADAYKPVIQKTVNDLETSLSNSVQQVGEIPGMISNQSDVMHATMENSIKTTLTDFVTYATNSSQLTTGIHRVLFDEKLPYKGDCNHPARLTRKMPPPGESWTMEECEKMDYRCGNPPSICHFLDDVKQRVVGFIRRQLIEYATFDSGRLIKDLVQNMKNELHGVLDGNSSINNNNNNKNSNNNSNNATSSSIQDVESYIDKVVSAMIRSVDVWVSKNVRNICDTPDQQELCNHFDNDVKLAILKWP